MILTKRQETTRDRLLGIQGGGDLTHFRGLDHDTARVLMDKGLADPGDRQNEAPSFAAFTQFMQDSPKLYSAHGYALSRHRSDCRVTIEGLEFHGKVTVGDAERFRRFCEGADELEIESDRMRSWWD